MTVGHHPTACTTPGCPHGTYRKGGKCRVCDPVPGYFAHDRYRKPVAAAKVIGGRRRGRRPMLCAPELCPADYLAACAAELARRAEKREAAIAKVCRDLRSEAT